jgi:RHS repeat-associated protein
MLTGTTTDYAFLTSRTLTNSYSYDAASNRDSMTDPEGGVTSYTYDTLNRLTGLTDFNFNSFGLSYDQLGRRTSLTRPNGVSTSYQYDSLSRLLSVLHQVGANTLDGAAYTVDAAGNRTSKSDALAGTTSNYTYDAIYQLTQVVASSTPPTTTENYSFDAVGNRLSSLGVAPYSYDDSNELTSTPNVSFTYDANGNTTSETDGSGATSYTWDFENRLSSVTLPGSGGSVNFKYDPFGRRIQKVSASGTTVYAYDGDNVIAELDGSGSAVSRYTQGLGIDEPLAMSRGGVTSFYHADGLASVTSLTDPSGQVAASYTYDSFGNLTASTGNITNPFRYTARELDLETGLYYYRGRYYASNTGRFVSEDSARFTSGASNFFPYVDGSPLNFRDPYGYVKSAPCCQRNIDYGKEELERVLNNAQLARGTVVKKYKDCLQKFPQMKIRCDDSLTGCGEYNPAAVSTIIITPLGATGRKGRCGPVASTFLHEMVHICYENDLSGKPLSGLGKEKEAYQAECDVFGYGCACARDPRKCGY